MRAPVYVASLVAALLALLPASIRLYESLAGRPASVSLYLAWLAAWLFTALALLWALKQRPASARTRLALGLAGGGMLVALVMIVAAASETPNTGATLGAVVSSTAVVVGSGMAGYDTRTDRVALLSWSVAAIGALVLTITSAFLSNPNISETGLAAGSFLLGVGLSLALGRVELPEDTTQSAAAPSHES